MQAVLESRDIQDIAKQMQENMPKLSRYDEKEKREAGIITSYEISKITGEANCKVSDRIRRLVPRGKIIITIHSLQVKAMHSIRRLH